LENLETGVLHALTVWRGGTLAGGTGSADDAVVGTIGSFRELLRQVAIQPSDELDSEPWFCGADLPLRARQENALGHSWLERCRTHKIRLRAICSDVVLTRRFNRETLGHDSKGRALSEMSMHVLRHIWQVAGGDEHDAALVIADKHGGRNRYHEFLPIVFGDRFIRCHEESLERSRYRVGKTEVRFETKSERHLPVALASMVSKYLRELAMTLFNRFWIDRQPTLKRTAGYPTDASRFKQDIANLQAQLGISDEILWRER
jgi:hypothetical protein